MIDVVKVGAGPLWEAAEHLGIEVEDVVDLVIAGRVPTVRRANGRPLVDPAAVKRVLATSTGAQRAL